MSQTRDIIVASALFHILLQVCAISAQEICYQHGDIMVSTKLYPSYSPLNESSSVHIDCANACKDLEYKYAWIESSMFCLCSMDTEGLTESASSCTMSCDSSLKCGAEGSQTIYTMIDLEAGLIDSPSIQFLPLVPSIVVVSTEVKFTITSTSTEPTHPPYYIDFGSGEGPILGDNSLENIKIYDIPGTYFVKAYVETSHEKIIEIIVQVSEAPTVTITCPTKVVLNKETPCEVADLSTLGYDFTYSYQLKSNIIDEAQSYKLPSGNLMLYGSRKNANANLDPLLLPIGTVYVIGGSYSEDQRYILKFSYSGSIDGQIGFYAVQKKSCDSNSYCGVSDTCMVESSCLTEGNTLSCSSELCPTMGTCSAQNSCLHGTGATENSATIIKLQAYPVSVGEHAFDVNIGDLIIPAYSYIGIGCLNSADCPEPSTMNNRAKEALEMTDYTVTQMAAMQETNIKILMQFVTRSYEPLVITQSVLCTHPAPVENSAIGDQTLESAKDFISLSSLSFKYQFVSDIIEPATEGEQSIICQKPIAEPLVNVEHAERNVAQGEDLSFEVVFPSGSPVFIEVTVDSQNFFYYQDDAEVWTYKLENVNFANQGDFTLTGKATNLENEVEFSAIIHVIPPVSETWTINFACPCFDYEGFNLNVERPSSVNPPWAANATYSDNGEQIGDVDLRDFKTKGNNGIAEAILFSKLLELDIPGVHEITVVLTNEITTFTVKETVTVEEGIKNFEVGVAWKTIEGEIRKPNDPSALSFIKDEEIVFTINATGLIEKYHCINIEEEDTQETPDANTNTISFTFAEDGVYTIQCGAYNYHQEWVYAENITLAIVSELQGISLSDSEETLLKNLTKVIKIDFAVYHPESCTFIDFNDTYTETYGNQDICMEHFPEDPHIKQTLVAPLMIKHTYEKFGFYDARSIAVDQKGKLSAEGQIIAYEIPCEIPEVSIVNAYTLPLLPMEIFKSMQIVLNSASKINCTGEVKITNEWIIEETQKETGTALRIIDLSEGTLINMTSLLIKERSLEYGTYKATFYVHIHLLEILTKSAWTYIEVVKTPLIASMINGGATRISRGFGQKIELDFTGSRDPDDPEDYSIRKSQLILSLFCRDETEEFPVNITIEIDSTPESEYQPLPNEEPSTTGEGCFGSGLNQIEIPNDQPVLYASFFDEFPATYEFGLQVRKDTRIATSFLAIEVSEIPVPLVKIECFPAVFCYDYNNKKYINPSNYLPLRGSILNSDKVTSSLEYRWGFFDTNGNALDIPSGLTTDRAVPDITVNETQFMNNPEILEYVIKFTAIENVEGSSEILITVNQPPLDGTCSVDKMSGLALVDTFSISCMNWIDKEGMGISSYTFSYIDTEDEKALEGTLATGQERSFEMALPFGKLAIKARIEDALNAETVYVLGIVIVGLPTEEQIEAYNPEEKMATFSTNNDKTSLNMLFLAMNSINKEADYMSVQNLLNKTESEVESLRRDLSGNQLYQLQMTAEEKNIKSTADMNLFSTILQSALQSVFDGQEYGTLVSLETIQYAEMLTDNIIEAFNTVPAASPQMYVPTISNIIDSMEARICSSNLIVAIEKFSPIDMDDADYMYYDPEIKPNTTIEESFEDQMAKNILETTRRRSREQVYSILDGIYAIFSGAVEKMRPGEILASHSPNNASLIIGIQDEKNSIDKDVILKSKYIDAQITIPKGFCPSSPGICDSKYEYVFIVWTCMPFYYPETSKYLSNITVVVTLNLYMDKQLIKADNVTDPFNIRIPLRDFGVAENKTIIKPTMNEQINMAYHKYTISSMSSSIVIEIKPENFTQNLVIYIHFGRLPTYNNYTFAKRIFNLDEGNNGYKSLFLKSPTSSSTVYIGIANLEHIPSSGELSTTAANLKSNLETNYYINAYSTGCFFFNELRQEWETHNVRIVNAENFVVECESDHLSDFGISYLHMPNLLSFEYIFANVGFIDNLTLYITLIIFTSLFIIMFIYGFIMDRADIEKRGVLPLPDNKLDDKYLYEISFWTGPHKEASTSSNIMFIASGDLDETDWRLLPQANKKLYKRFEVNRFVMSAPGPLGVVNYLRVLHDNSGEPPLDSWQIHKATIKDLQTKATFTFNINSWLAFDRDGKIDKTFNRSGKNESSDYSDRFYYKMNRIFNEDHIWLSVFLRPVGSRFTRIERCLVCASFLYLSMMLSALWYDSTPEEKLESVFKFGPFAVNNEEIIIALAILIIVIPITTLFTFVFKRAKPRKLKNSAAIEGIEKQRYEQLNYQGFDENLSALQCMVEKTDTPNPVQKETSNRITLPFWTRYLMWILAFLIIGTSIFFIWSYGVMFGETKTIRWFSSFLLSFFASILVLQFIKIFLVSCISACFKNDKFFVEDIDCDEELPELKWDEEWTDYQNIQSGKKVHNMKGVDDNDDMVSLLRARVQKNREMTDIIKGMTWYLIFLAILFTIVNFRLDKNSYLLHNHLEETFIKHGHLHYDFKGLVKTSNEWWKWAKNVLLQELRAQPLYNKSPPYGHRGFMDDLANRNMGHAIIRQIRTKPNNCRPAHPMDSVIEDCSGVRGILSEDTQDYCFGWTKNETFDGSCSKKISAEFRYESTAVTKAYQKLGYMSLYSGGGYVMHLSGSQPSLLKKMKKLHKAGWIDKHTKALFFEFSVYNPGSNLFAICHVLAEFTEGGGIVPSWRFDPIRLTSVEGFQQYFIRVVEILFCIATILFTLKELWKLKKLKCEYFSSYWNKAEIFSILASYATIGLYIYKYYETSLAIDKFNKTRGEGYIRLDSAVMADQWSLYCMSFILFFSLLKIIQMLQFNNKINALALTIRGCWEELKIFLLAFIIVFFAFACLFYFMFNSHLSQFSTIIYAVETSFVMIMGKFDYEEMNNVNPLSPLLFFLFSLLNSFVLINLMLSIIINTFVSIKTEMAKRKNRLEIIDFMWRSTKQRLRVEKLSRTHIIPGKSQKEGSRHSISEDDKTHQLPGKVNKLLEQINDMYFEGKLDFNDPQHKSSFLKGFYH